MWSTMDVKLQTHTGCHECSGMEAAPCWAIQFEKQESYSPHTNTPPSEMGLIVGRCLGEKPCLGRRTSPECYTSKTTWLAQCGGNWKMRCRRWLPSPVLINKLDAYKSWDVYSLCESMHAGGLRLQLPLCRLLDSSLMCLWASEIFLFLFIFLLTSVLFV